LAARYRACCKARTLSPPTAARVDLAETARTRLLPQPAHERSSGPSLTAGCVVLRLDRYYDRLRRPPSTRPLPGSTPVIERRGPRLLRSAWAGEGLPSSRRHPPKRSAPSSAGESLAAALQDLHRFHGLHREPPGSALPRCLPTRQASHPATDRLVASPSGLVTLGFDLAGFPARPPACYRASWQLPGPDSHRLATTSL
jgi:hypothetical protein